jgi:hypothetical protein
MTMINHPDRCDDGVDREYEVEYDDLHNRVPEYGRWRPANTLTLHALQPSMQLSRCLEQQKQPASYQDEVAN